MTTMNTATLDLEPLVRAAAQGDTTAFGRLVDSSRNAVASIALAICRDWAASEDIAQEVYLIAWRRLHELRNPDSFLPWIRQITRYTARTWVRDRQVHDRQFRDPVVQHPRVDAQNDVDDLLARAIDPHRGPETRLLDDERNRLLHETLDELSAESREVVTLYYREGRSSKQVARLLGLTDGAVRKRLERVRATLRQEVLQRYGDAALRSAPGVAFSAAVLAAVASASTASAAGLAGAAASTQVGTKALTLLGGAGLGMLGGAAGVVLGLRHDFRHALDDQERRQLRQLRNIALLAILLTSGLFAWPSTWNHWLPPTAGFGFLLATLGFLYIGWLPKILRRRYMAEEAGDLAAVERRLRQRRRQAWLGMLLGGLSGAAGLVLGMLSAGLL